MFMFLHIIVWFIFFQSPDSDYANLQQLNIEPPSALPEPTSPPLPEQSKYQKTLMAKWDMYLDPATNRVFYVHKDTKERNWKPPRDRDMPGTFHHEMYKQVRGGVRAGLLFCV